MQIAFILVCAVRKGFNDARDHVKKAKPGRQCCWVSKDKFNRGHMPHGSEGGGLVFVHT